MLFQELCNEYTETLVNLCSINNGIQTIVHSQAVALLSCFLIIANHFVLVLQLKIIESVYSLKSYKCRAPGGLVG